MTNSETAYEKAIDAYQFNVSRYHTWMNYYSIFVGALFVALYTVWPEDVKGWLNDSKNLCYFLPLVITFLGLFASVCWQASLIGHYTWIKSFIKILHDQEIEVLGKNLYVYSRIYTSDRDKVRKSPCRGRYYAPGYISTQKITQWFVGSTMFAWMLTISVLLKGCLSTGCFFTCLSLSVIIWCILRFTRFCAFSDVLDGMTK